jgi:GNAT superfamily N-acetyltransferase
MTAGQLVVRNVQRTDLAALTALCVEHAAYERATVDWEGHEDRLTAALFGEAPRLAIWVAVMDNVMVGYLSATTDCSTWRAKSFIYMDCLYVCEPWRGQRIGEALMHALAEHARAVGIDRIEWQTPAWNEGAIRFYERLGAPSAAKRRFSLLIN